MRSGHHRFWVVGVVLLLAGLLLAPGALAQEGGDDSVIYKKKTVYNFEDDTRAQIVTSIRDLSYTLRRSDVVGAGDYDADGDCDAAFDTGNDEIWLLLLDENGTDYIRRIDKPRSGEEWELVGFGSEAPLPSQ